MIKIIEKDFLDDNFILKNLTSNINLNEKIKFNKDDVYYFGNYNTIYVDKIKKKINKNKKNIRNAVEKGIKFLITGNSTELFNNNFSSKDINLFTCYNKKCFKKNKIKNAKNKKRLIEYNNLNKIDNENFKYKNLICIKNLSDINKIIKMTK